MSSNLRHYLKLDEQLRLNVDEVTRSKIPDGMDYIKQSLMPELITEWAGEIASRMECLFVFEE